MEEFGSLTVRLVLQSNLNRIRFVTLFKAHGTKKEAAKSTEEFMQANGNALGHAQLEFLWQVQDERLQYDDVRELAGKIARVATK